MEQVRSIMWNGRCVVCTHRWLYVGIWNSEQRWRWDSRGNTYWSFLQAKRPESLNCSIIRRKWEWSWRFSHSWASTVRRGLESSNKISQRPENYWVGVWISHRKDIGNDSSVIIEVLGIIEMHCRGRLAWETTLIDAWAVWNKEDASDEISDRLWNRKLLFSFRKDPVG